jgi:hypothetical protein
MGTGSALLGKINAELKKQATGFRVWGLGLGV